MMKRNYYKIRRMGLGLILALFCMSAFSQTVTLPTVDGDGSDAAWDVGTVFPIEAVIDVSTVDDAADLSGDVTVIWSADSIYVRVNVLDEKLYGGAGDAYNYDNVCIYFDVFNKATGAYVDSTQMYFEKNWWQAADQMSGRYGTDWMAPPYGNFAVDTADGATGYTLELAVGWTEIDKVPAVDDKMGFDVKLSDNDGVDGGDGRDQIAWCDISDGGWNNPMLWGEITLVADGSVTGQTEFTAVTTDGMDERAWTKVPAWGIEAAIDKSTVSNDADLSGNVKAMWSDDSLYVKVYQADEKLYGGSGDAYNYDNVCIYFDVFNKGTDSYVDSTQMYFEKNWWQAADQMSGRYGPDWMAPPYGNFAVDTADGKTGYTIELTIGWDELDKTPAVGDKMGFDVKLSDNDGVDGGEGRDQIAWRDVTDGGWNNPAVWGEITLMADGVISGQNDFPVAVDGVITGREWAMAPSFDIEAGVNDAPFVFNDADLDGTFKLMWNEDQILFSTLVYDDTLAADYDAADNYQYDNIAIFFDLLLKNTDSYVDTTQFYYERHWWGADSTGLGARWGADWNWPPADTFFTALTDTSYIMELALNWTDFITEAPAAGSVIGFDVKLSDRDSEDIPRDQVSWADATDGAWNNPSLFGELTLLANGNVEEYAGPAAVSNLAAAVDEATVTLTWDAVDGAAAYNVYRGTTLIGDSITEVTLADADLENGDYTYSVSTLDMYGIEATAATVDATVLVGIENSVMNNAIVYPNPASDILYVKSLDEMQSISLITLTGQVVSTVAVNDYNKNLNISELKSGLYFVSVRFVDHSENYKILIK